MIRKAAIVVLTLASTGTSYLWVDSYRGRVALTGRPFSGWCLDRKLTNDRGLHITVRGGGICPSYRCPVNAKTVGGIRELTLTGNLGYVRYPYQDFKPCMLNAEHQFVAPPGMRLVVHTVCLPLWLLVGAFASYPVLAFIRGPLRRWRRRRRGLCVNCAYDLTGNVTGVCSECGTKIESP